MTVADAARPRRPARPALRWLKPADAAGSAADSTGGLGAAGAGECGGAGSGAGECCGAAMADQSVDYPVTRSEELFAGRIWDVLGEEVALPDGQSVWREFVAHPGAAAVIAINDQGQVLLQRQYRHPVAMELWEPPAGLLDVPDEPPIETARRELVEEADLEAADWRQLVSFLSTPGGTSEAIYVYLARGLTEVPAERRYQRFDEEARLVPCWVDLDRAVELVMRGALHSPTAVTGLLAAIHARGLPGGWDALPPA